MNQSNNIWKWLEEYMKEQMKEDEKEKRDKAIIAKLEEEMKQLKDGEE